MKADKQPAWNGAYIVLFVVNMLVSTTLYMTNTCMAGYLSGMGVGAPLVGTILGVMSISSMVTRPVSGFVCDHSRRKRLLVLFLGLNVAVLFGYGIASAEWVFVVLRILHGIAFGMTTTVLMAYVTAFIPEGRMAQGMGYFALGQSIAAAVGPSIALWMMQTFGGQATFAVAGTILAIGLVIVLALLPEARQVQAKHRAGKPINLSDFVAKQAVPYALITVALSAANGIETSYIAVYAQTLGLGNTGWYFTVSAATLFAARLLFGRVTDRRGFAWALYPGMALIGVAFAALALAGRFAPPVVFFAAACLKACGVGLLQPAIQAMCVQAVPASRRGAASSTYYIGTDLGQGGSTLLAGQLIPALGYGGLFWVFLIPVGVVTAWFSVRRRAKM